MNGTYYPNPTFPEINNNNENNTMPIENYNNLYSNQNNNPEKILFIEDILKFNKGKKVNVFASFTDSNNDKDKTYSGIVENSGPDYVIISDPKTGKWYLIKTMYINYIEFEEPIKAN
ncbi:MAG: spore coat protein GerQ [Bacilli bacterium]|nr:spore coat protein GerQ [Bacilli bacterium]